MSKARSTGNLNNSILISDTGAITFVSGSTTLASLSTTGQLSGSAPVLFAATSSFANAFTVAGTLTAQTLVVQTVTSSVVYSSGSNVFGNNIANTQTFTGSVSMTGSLAVVTNGTEFQVTNTGVRLGNALTDTHIISGSLTVNPNGLFVSGSGNVGIGTSSPLYRTHIITANNTTGLVVSTNANDTETGLYVIPDHTNSVVKILASGGTNKSLAFFYGNTEGMRITSAGNVGIGTASPSTTLTVYKTRLGSITTQTPNNLYLQSEGYTGSGYNTIDFGSTSYGVPLARIGVGIFGDGTYMMFGTSNAYVTGITNIAMTIGPTGNVGIGNGTTGSPNNRLLVQGGNIAKGTTFGFDGAVDNMIKYGAQQDLNASGQFLDRWIGIDATVTAGAGSSNLMIFKVYSGGGSGSPRTAATFNGDGSVFNFNNSTSWQQTSDIKIKDNIRPINNALDKLCALNPTHFEYKNNLGKTKTGFIAQEFEQVFAGHVTENVPSGDFKQYFEEGEMMKSIDADLIPYLVKAIQELKSENDTLKEILQRNNIQ